MACSIHKLMITGLNGIGDLALSIENNRLILIGENGTGKSTVITILYYVLTGQWKKLEKYDFKKLSIHLNDEEFQITPQDLSKRKDRRTYLEEHVTKSLSRFNITAKEALEDFSPSLWRKLGGPRPSMSPTHLKQILETLVESPLPLGLGEERSVLERLTDKIDFFVLYLPTYRRIEHDLKNVFPGLDEDLAQYRRKNKLSRSSDQHVELVEFGMEDVSVMFDKSMTQVKDHFRNSLNDLTGGYLRVLLQKEYRDVDLSALETIDESTINSILSRIDENILSKRDHDALKATIKDLSDHKPSSEPELISAHVLINLLVLHQDQLRNESDVNRFVSVCNKYLLGKKLFFDKNNFTLKIFPASRIGDETIYFNKNEIEPGVLSSGEKQIVSLFAHLYLSGRNNYFVIIDEPELSLSVPWQSRFLPDILDSDKCQGLVAVTHSPFIYDNELQESMREISEYIEDAQ